MGGFAFNFGGSGSNPAVSFGPVAQPTFGGGAGIPGNPSVPATSFDAGDILPTIDNLSGVALAFLKQVQGNDLQNEIVAANKGQGGVVVTPGGTTATGAGALSGAFGSASGTIAGIPIMYLVIALILFLLFRR